MCTSCIRECFVGIFRWSPLGERKAPVRRPSRAGHPHQVNGRRPAQSLPTAETGAEAAYIQTYDWWATAAGDPLYTSLPLKWPVSQMSRSDTAFHLSVFVDPCRSTFTSLLAPPWNTTLLYLPQYLVWGIATNRVEILVPSVTSQRVSILGWKIPHTHFDDGVALAIKRCKGSELEQT